ncbi:unnamed protein product [Caenorhabditis brenneri]
MEKCNKNVWIDLEYNGIQIKFRVTSLNDLLMPQIWCDIENRQFLPIALHSTVCDVFNTPKIIKVRMGISKNLIAQFPSITEIDHLSEGTYWRRIRADGSALEELLKRVKINHSLNINTLVKFDSNSPILSVDHLKIASGFHMTREDLFNFSGKSGMFWCTHKLKNDDLIDFVKRWLKGSNTKLESLYLANQTNGPSFDKEKILEQFDTKPWDPKRRDGRFMYSKNAVRWQSDIDILDCTQQLDIEREHDGLLATIIVTEKLFCFFVWHTPFAKPGNNLPVMAKSNPNELPKYYLGSVVY